MKPKQYTAKNILEIGIGPKGTFNGGSIKLWSKFFKNATIYALDIINIQDVWSEIKNIDNIKLYTSTDAYNANFFNNNLKDIKFDILIDDGPHTLESMIKFVTMYSQLLTDDGILIVEDIQFYDWIVELTAVTPIELKKYIEVYDIRHVKNRYDDILFVINKTKNNF
jgi:hypothetical protein